LRADWKEARQLVASYPSQLMSMADIPAAPPKAVAPPIDLFRR